MKPKIKEILEKQLQLLFESKEKKKAFFDKFNERMTEKRSFAVLGIAVLVQSIFMLKVILQIREICETLVLLTERLNLLM